MRLVPPAPPTTEVITGKQLFKLGDIGRCELVEGRIVMLNPNTWEHASVESDFQRELAEFIHPRKLGQILIGGVGVYTRRNPDTVRGIDILYISKERARNFP